MSRVGKQRIAIPDKTTVTIDGGVVDVKGPLGELSRTFKPGIRIEIDGSEIIFTPEREDDLELKALWGTYASHVANMVKGVNEAYQKKLIVEGVGYRAELNGTDLIMQLGFSHPVVIPVPEGITVTVEKSNITVSGIDKELVGHFAATIRANKKPEPYKGKGIRYSDEVIRRKEGKRAA